MLTVCFREAVGSVMLCGATSIKGALFCGGGCHTLEKVMTCQCGPLAKAGLALRALLPISSLLLPLWRGVLAQESRGWWWLSA